MRALETAAETLHRQEQNRTSTAIKRALEEPVETLHRQEQNRTSMAKKRASVVPIGNCIANFQSKLKVGPEFVCTCCHVV